MEFSAAGVLTILKLADSLRYMNNPLHQEIAKLRRQLDEANETILNLTSTLNDGTEEFYGVAGLSRMEARFVGAIAKHGRIPRERLIAAVWGNDGLPGLKTIDVTVCHIRKKLRRHNIQIATLYDYGYEMSSESIGLLRLLAGGVPAQEAA